MKIFLLALLGGAAGILLVVVLGIWYIKRRVSKFFEGIADQVAAAGETGAPSPRLTLEPDDAAVEDVPDDQRAAWDAWSRQLEALDFEAAGTFRVTEMPGAVLRGFANPARGAWAAIYSAPGAPLVADVVSDLPGDRTLMHTTLRDRGLATEPWCDTRRLPGADAAALVEAHLAGRSAAPAAPVRAESFREEFERRAARSAEWRILRGVTVEEIRGVAASDGRELSDAEARSAHAMSKVAFAIALEKLIAIRLREASGMTEEAWEEREERVLVVRDDADAGKLARDLVRRLGVRGEERELLRSRAHVALSSGPLRAAFAELVPSLPGDAPSRLASIDAPLGADAWLMRAIEDDEDDD